MSYSENLRLEGDGHSRILNALLRRYRASKTKMEEYSSKLDLAEKSQMLYRKTENVDGKPDPEGYEDIVIPYDYASVLTAHTYWTSVFLSRSPILQYTGRQGEGEHQVQAVEALMDYQVQMGRWLPAMYGWIYDAASYPFGVVCNYWADEYVYLPKIEEVQVLDEYGMPYEGKTKKEKVTQRMLSYSGNRIFNVNPRDFFPDHRKPISACQEGEYCGYRTVLSWNDLVRRTEQKIYYNMEEVKKRRIKKAQENFSSWKDVNDNPESLEDHGISYLDPVSIIEIYVELIPADWKLGTSKSPEVWRFAIADEQVIVESRPLGNLSTRFPFFVMPYDYDSHVFMGKSLYDVMAPMTKTLNWLINTHVYNVRQIVNNKIVFDPSRIVAKDLFATDNRGIRLKPSAYGTDPNTAYSQFQLVDVTKGHLNDAQMFVEMLQRLTGITDNVMGMVNQGGRKTATEIRSSGSMGINRLKTTAEWWSAVALGPLSIAALQNTQQFMEVPQLAKIVGDLPPNGVEQLMIAPEDIMGFYNFVAVDGTLPVDRYAQANLWREMLQGMTQIPQVAGGYDIAGIFAWVAQLAGLKNIKQFRLQPMDPGMIQNGVDRGNLVGLPGREGAGAGTSANVPGRVPEPGQISGMGSTG